MNRTVALLLSGLLVLSLSACSVRQQLIRQVADEMSQQSVEEEDIGLAREASAFYLKLAESLLRSVPGHVALAQSVTSGLTQYAYAFLSNEADRLESHSLAQAQVLRERAARMFERAQKQGWVALTLRHPGLASQLLSMDLKALRLQPDEVGLAYWTAAAWGGQISLSKDIPDVVADLPLVVNLATLAWQTNPAYGDGSLASLMGTLELARPGGSPSRALAYWDQAIEISRGQSPGPFVAKAEGWAVEQQDRTAFEAWLNKAIEVSQGKRDLSSQIMRERAVWLLRHADDIF
ncbi:TRAP transporter TatT component family protein [Limnohabitans sp. Rim8]|uniref:TRAP transporter TatT component family protein n=1 Tax=Limnohabitans sp. Rim8 TaxID=1100718 RepID=UPI0026325A32|nr:TRAP transporter TatT component family protein [Limnohabitans sp. Rim8]